MDSIRSREARRQLDVMRVWRFGNAALDETTLELSVDGHAVAIDRKAVELLLLLLHHAGEPVTKRHVVETVWHGRPVSDDAVAHCLGTLRRALDDHARTVIETLEGPAYRLTPPVQVQGAAAANLLPDDLGDLTKALR